MRSSGLRRCGEWATTWIRFGNGIVAVADAAEEYGRRAPDPDETTHTHGVMLHVENADAHHDHARQAGAHILSTPTDFPFGRQYTLKTLPATTGPSPKTSPEQSPRTGVPSRRTPSF